MIEIFFFFGQTDLDTSSSYKEQTESEIHSRIMSCLCLGGVCIPYTALLPMLLIGLQWIASQFAKVGLLPESIARRLGLAAAASAGTKDRTKDRTKGGGEGRGCCGNGGGESAVDDREGEEVVEHVEDLARWETLFTAASEKSTLLFVKFTADWCKPCKSIQPVYASLASMHRRRAGGVCKFVTLDVDGDGCDVVSGKLKVAMLPTFVCFEGGKEVGRMSGGNDGGKLGDWVDEMLCR